MGTKTKPEMRSFKGLFSSINQKWKTPLELYNELNKEFDFDFDPCPDEPESDGLDIEWGERNFVNPPYNQLTAWMEKGFEEFKKGKLVVFLIPSRTDTRWWHNFCMKATEIRFIKGRLSFEGFGGGSAPFPSCVVIFKGGYNGMEKS